MSNRFFEFLNNYEFLKGIPVLERIPKSPRLKKALDVLLVVVLCFVAFHLLFSTDSDDYKIEMVKNGYMDLCPNYTVEQMVKSFMGNPKWKHIVDEDGKDYVNISGDITYFGKPSRAMLQLWVYKTENFGFQAFEINGVPQNSFVAMGLISNMCAAAMTNF